MYYINIDENRFQTGYGNKIDFTICVDCLAPSNYYKLKTDYQSFSGEEQWEFYTVKYIADLKTEVGEYNIVKFYEAMNTPYTYYSFTYKANWKDLYVGMGYSIDKGYATEYTIRNAEENATKTFDTDNKDGIIGKMGEVFDSLFTQKHSYEASIASATTVKQLEDLKANISYNVN